MVFLTKVVFGLTIFAIGAIVGSLCSTYIYRAQNGIAITKVKSMCPYYEKQIKIYNLIPIISFIVLEGRCKLCNGRIPWESFVLETLCGITAITIFALYEGSPKIFVIFFSLAVLLCVFLLDLRTMEIPNELSIALLVLGVFDSFFSTDISLLDRGIGLVIISIPMFLLALAVNNALVEETLS